MASRTLEVVAKMRPDLMELLRAMAGEGATADTIAKELYSKSKGTVNISEPTVRRYIETEGLRAVAGE